MNTKKTLLTLVFSFFSLSLYAGTTGKIWGRINWLETGDPLPKVNVIIVGTNLGAATDNEGNYFIINIPPGEYILEAEAIGFKKTRTEGVKVTADKSTKVDFNLEYSDQFVLEEKSEPFFLEDFTDGERIELLKLKQEDKKEYQKQLLMRYYYPAEFVESEEAVLYKDILKLTKEIDKLGEKYKFEEDEKAQKQIQKDMMQKLDERFTLQEKKMEMEIKKLSKGIENLRKELQKFRNDKELIIKKQFESFID
jgi:hypothetical protein